MTMKTALILAGAVAKGAFGAGVLAELSKHAAALPIANVVGASAGALNACVFATGVRSGRALEVSERLASLWETEATWHNVLRVSATDLLGGRGVGDGKRLVPIMRGAMAPLPSGGDALSPMTLGLVVTALNGRLDELSPGEYATTFEQTVQFTDADFDTDAGRDRLVQTALGSAAFPLVFAPVDVPDIGPCIDGGAVNNTPIRRVLDADDGIERILVVTTEPLVIKPEPGARGIALIGQIADILINERLFRDLHEAKSVNRYLEELDALRAKGVPEETLLEVKKILGWEHREIVQIRPASPLDGSSFKGFSHPELMQAYVAAGREAAKGVLGELGISS